MTPVAAKLLAQFSALPEGLQQQALDYLAYLQQKAQNFPTLVKPADSESNGSALAQLMAEAAEKNLLLSIADPVAWQKALRQDRSLPGRE